MTMATEAVKPGLFSLDGTLIVIMAGIKQNGILVQLPRDSWLVSAEHLA